MEVVENINNTLEQDKDFQNELRSLDRTPAELAREMQSWGDQRSFQAIIRSIQRMSSCETSISGEMRVIIRMMLYQQHLNQKKYVDVKWVNNNNGNVSTVVEDFIISLYPQTKNRWLVCIVHKNGYSHPWPIWPNGLEAAKRKALICLEEAIRVIEEF